MLKSNWLGDPSRSFCSAKRTETCSCVAHDRKRLNDASRIKVAPTIPGRSVLRLRKGAPAALL